MLFRRHVVALIGAMSACLALAVAPHASAGNPAPSPTVSVSVTAAGHKLPPATTKAAWNAYGTDGQQAQLVVDIHNGPGMLSTVDALWTSRNYRVYPKIPAFRYKIETEHDATPTASTPASFTFGFRYRDAGKQWSRWYDQTEVYQSGQPLQGAFRDQKLTFGGTRATLKQLQFRIHTEIADVGKEHQVWTLVAMA